MSNEVRPYKAVVAFDFSELSERSLERALDLCSSHDHAEVHVLTVAAHEGTLIRLPGEQDIDPMEKEAADEYVRGAVAKLVDAFAERGGRVTVERIAVYVAVGHPSERIVALADAIDADVILMGTHSRSGLTRLVLGSVAEAVVRRASCGVFVLRPKDFYHGARVPSLEPPLKPGEHSLHPFELTPVYHYVSRSAGGNSRVVL